MKGSSPATESTWRRNQPGSFPIPKRTQTNPKRHFAMNINTHLAAQSILLATSLLLPSCNYKYDTVSFGAVGKAPAAKTPVPKIEIDTNMSVGTLMGGSVKGKKPYDIQAYYMDDTFTFPVVECVPCAAGGRSIPPSA